MSIPLVSILVAIIILALCLWVLRRFSAELGPTLSKVLYVLVVVVFVLWLLGALGLLSGSMIHLD